MTSSSPIPDPRLLDGRGAAHAEASTAVGGDLVSASVADFAAQLRELRARAGRPSYRQLAQIAHYSHTTLSQAAAGHSLPSLAVTLAFADACGGDVNEWAARWHQVHQAVEATRSLDGPPDPPVPGPATPVSRWRAAAGWLPVKIQVAAAAGIAVAACTVLVLLWPAGTTTVTSLPEQARPRLEMESSGLYVRYVVVTNLGTRAGYAFVVNVADGNVHRSPRPVPPGRSWMYSFNRDLKDGAEICVSIDLGPEACAAVHARDR